MNRSILCRYGLTVLVTAMAVPALHAQHEPDASLVLRLAGIPAPVGFESDLADTLQSLLSGATRDRAGDVILVRGRGMPRRLVACPMDEPGWIVGGIRDDGYLTVRRLPGRASPFFDQQLEGQRITILGDTGPVPGVVGVRSIHLTRRRAADDPPFTFDDAYVDVGVRSADEARALGIRVTAPLVLERRPTRYGSDLVAAPAIGTRSACAALVHAADASPRGTVVIAFVVEQGLSARGLRTIGHEHGPFSETLLLDAGVVDQPVVSDSVRQPDATSGLGRLVRWRLRDRFDGWPVETIAMTDVGNLAARLRAWIGDRP
jgi:putative aminopeptidase FrvX